MAPHSAEAAADGGLCRGAFARALVEIATGSGMAAGRQFVTLWDFATYVKRRVGDLTDGKQHPQCPVLQDVDTDIRIVSAGPSAPGG